MNGLALSNSSALRSRSRLDGRALDPAPGGKSRFIFWLFIAALAVRAAALVWTPLIPEEAYYWMYSQHPNLSYYDHPPMIAWIIALGTRVLGHTELGVRLIGHLLMVASSFVMYALARLWYGRRTALIAAAALQVLTLYYGIGFITTMDSPLLLFWLLFLLGVGLALKRNQAAGWYLAGAALGAALLSKYSAIFLPAGAFLALCAHRRWRRKLLSPHPYLALMIAALMVSPVIIWNAQHNWASFRFQFLDRYAGKPFNPAYVAECLAIQVMVATPFVLIAAGWWLARKAPLWRKRRVSSRWAFAACFSLPLLAVTVQKSLRVEIHLNWTAPAYLSLLPVAAHVLRLSARRRSRLAGLGTTVIAVCLCINVIFLTFLMTVHPRLQQFSPFGPWEDVAAIVEDHEDRLVAQTGEEPLIIAAGRYRLASVLAFYRMPIEDLTRPSQLTTSQWVLEGRGLGYEYWSKRQDWRGRDCIYVDDSGEAAAEIMQKLRPWFESVEWVEDPRLQRHPRYRVAIGRNFRG